MDKEDKYYIDKGQLGCSPDIEEDIINESKSDIENFKLWCSEYGNNVREGTDFLYNWFNLLKNRLVGKEKDIYYWMGLNNGQQQLADKLTKLENTPTNKDKDEEGKNGARLVYSDSDWKVYEITTYEASVKYGAHTKWCITGSKRWGNGEDGLKTWQNYHDVNKVNFYFFINKDGHKYALSIYPDNKNFEIFNDEDLKISFIPDAPKIEEIDVDYITKSDDKIIHDAIINQQFPEKYILKLLTSVISGYGELYYVDIFTKVEDFCYVLEDYIPDGYIEYSSMDSLQYGLKQKKITQEDYDKAFVKYVELFGNVEEDENFSSWDGDIPAIDSYDMSSIYPATTTLKQLITKADICSPQNPSFKGIKYFVVVEDLIAGSGTINIGLNDSWEKLLFNLSSWYDNASGTVFDIMDALIYAVVNIIEGQVKQSICPKEIKTILNKLGVSLQTTTESFEELDEDVDTTGEEIWYRGYSGDYGPLDSINSYIWVTDDLDYAKTYARGGKVAAIKLLATDKEIGSVYSLEDDVDYYDPGDEEFQECILDQGLKGYGFEAGDYDDFCLCISKDCVEVINPDVKVEVENESLNESKQDIEKFRQWCGNDELYNKFLKLKDRLRGRQKDIYYWMGLEKELLKNQGLYHTSDAKDVDFAHKKAIEALEWALEEIEQEPSKSQVKKHGKEGAKLIYEDENWLVYDIQTYEASVLYGKHTSWCVTGNNSDQGKIDYDMHTNCANLIFYIPKKGSKSYRHGKYALEFQSMNSWLLYNDADFVEVGVGSLWNDRGGLNQDIWNPEDTGGVHPDFPNINGLPDLNKRYEEVAKELGWDKPIILEEVGKTFKFPNTSTMQRALQSLEKDGYKLETIRIEDLVRDNNLLDNKELDYHKAIWGPNPDDYRMDDMEINDWKYSDVMSCVRKDNKLLLNNGKHRTRALYNSGYELIEIPTLTEDVNKTLHEKIVKKGSKWQVQSEKGKNLGTYDTKKEAEDRLKQVHYFKHINEDLLSTLKTNLSSYKYNIRTKGWHDKYGNKISIMDDDWEPDTLDWYYIEDTHIFEDDKAKLECWIDEENKVFTISVLWAKNNSKGEATNLIRKVLELVPQDWKIQINNNVNGGYWKHIFDKYFPNRKHTDTFESLKEEVDDRNIYYRGYDSRYGVFDSDNEYGQLYTWVTDSPEYALEYAENNEYGKVAKVRITCSDDEIGGVLDLPEDVDYYDPGDEAFEYLKEQGLCGYSFVIDNKDFYCGCVCILKTKCKVINDSVSLTEGLADVKKYYADIEDDMFTKLVSLDPTYKENSDNLGTYGKWILNLFKKGNLKEEDFYKVTEYLQDFDIKKKNFPNKDIQQFKTLPDLFNALQSVDIPVDSQNVKQKKFHKQLKKTELNADLVYEDSYWEVWIPKDYEASCKLSSNTEWCTGISSKGNSHYYDDYIRQGPLYICISKKDGKPKYQFHVESDSFMDAEDRPIDPEEDLFNEGKNSGLKIFYDKLKFAPYFKELGIDVDCDDDTKIDYDMETETKIWDIISLCSSNYRDNIDGKWAVKCLEDPFMAFNYYSIWSDGSQVSDYSIYISNAFINRLKPYLTKLGFTEEEFMGMINQDEVDEDKNFAVEIYGIIKEAISQGVEAGRVEDAQKDIRESIEKSFTLGTLKYDYPTCYLHFKAGTIKKAIIGFYYDGVAGYYPNNKIDDVIADNMIDNWKLYEPSYGWDGWSQEAFEESCISFLQDLAA